MWQQAASRIACLDCERASQYLAQRYCHTLEMRLVYATCLRSSCKQLACVYSVQEAYSGCDTSNPSKEQAFLYGHATGGAGAMK